MIALLSDITKLRVDAIVNAANATLLGGGETGGAKITKGCNLPAKYVIHTVGPVWNGGDSDEPELLRECYLSSLALAQEHGCGSVAFPCISTGVYGYPPEKAALVAVNACGDYVRDNNYTCEITFCCFSKEDLEIYRKVLKERA